MSDFEQRLNAFRASQSQPAQQPNDFESRLNAARQAPQAPVEPPVEPPKEADPWYEDLGEGLAVSGMETYYGIKDLVGLLDEEDQATLTDWQKDAAESGWGTAGKVIGEIAQIAAPAGGLTKAMKYASKAKTLGRTAPLLADVAATAGLEAVKLPQEGESRLDSAIEGATDALTGGMIARGLSKATRGLDVTDAAKTLMDKGAFITAGRAAKSPAAKGLEAMAEVTPFLARGVQKARGKAKDDWLRVAFEEAAPKGFKQSDVGFKGISQLKNAYDDAYSKAWSKADNINSAGRVDFVNAVSRGVDELPKTDANKVIRVAKEFNKVLGDISPKRIKDYDNQLRREIKSVALDNIPLRETLKQMRESIRKGLPEGAQNALKDVDANYAKYLAVKKAAGKATADTGEFTPQQLIQSLTASAKGKARKDFGDAPMQDIAMAGAQTVGQQLGGDLLGKLRTIMRGLPTPIPTQALSNMAIGRNPMQKAARNTIESETIKALRNYMPRSGQLGGVLLDDELEP